MINDKQQQIKIWHRRTPPPHMTALVNVGALAPEHESDSVRGAWAMVVRRVMLRLMPSSEKQYASVLRQWLAWCKERRVSVFDFDIENVVGFVESSNWNQATRLRNLSVIRRVAEASILELQPRAKSDDAIEFVSRLAYQYGVLKEYTPHTSEDESTNPHRSLTHTEVEAILSAPVDSYLALRDKAMIVTAIASGARASELVAMRWKQFASDFSSVHIPLGKGAKARDAVIFEIGGKPYAQILLATLRDTIPNHEYAFAGATTNGEPSSDTKARIGYRQYWQRYRDFCGHLGITNTKTHDGRVTMATLAYGDGDNVPLVSLSQLMGHEDPKTTQGYIKLADLRKLQKKYSL